MIEHRPFGIDDPYKRLPTERYPRDPVAGDEVQIGFRTGVAAREAWLLLEHEGGETRHEAQRTDPGLWFVRLPPLAAGAYRYRLVAGGDPNTESEPFELPVARRRRIERLLSVDINERSATLRLETADGAPALALLSSTGPGAVCLTFVPGRDPIGDPGTARPCRIERGGGRLRFAADGVALVLDEASLSLQLSLPNEPAALHGSLKMSWRERPDGTVSHYEQAIELAADEELYGLGERFLGPGLRGRSWDVRVYEEYKEQGGRSYLPIPFLLSSRLWGLWLDSDAPSLFDARGDTLGIVAEADPRIPGVRQQLLVAREPYLVTAAFTELVGPIALPPRWAYGPWMSANTWNSQAKAEAAVERTLAEEIPATVLVLEAWSDETTFYIFNDAEYEPSDGAGRLRHGDFRYGGRWPDPKALIDRCHAAGIRVLLWQIPVHKRLEEAHEQHRRDESHMLEQGYAVREADGSPYRNRGWWFPEALVLDVTHPQALAWWFDKRRYLFDEIGIDGMKTDGGEHLWGRDLRSHDGQHGVTLVNRYAQQYVDAYHHFVMQMTGGDGITFSRAGYTGAQRSPAHWAGDENSTWSAYRASILAGLSAGLAGISLWSWDLGGFSGEIPTVELYIRSLQMACFCPLMQYHSELHSAADNRERTPWNIAERHHDERALGLYRAYARLRMRLIDYIGDETEALAARGLPLMRYPGLVWPEMREELMSDPYCYLFGRDLLVCPVLEKGAESREVTLPPCGWIDLWSAAHFEGGSRVLAFAPLERIPVFVRADSPRLAALQSAAANFDLRPDAAAEAAV